MEGAELVCTRRTSGCGWIGVAAGVDSRIAPILGSAEHICGSIRAPPEHRRRQPSLEGLETAVGSTAAVKNRSIQPLGGDTRTRWSAAACFELRFLSKRNRIRLLRQRNRLPEALWKQETQKIKCKRGWRLQIRVPRSSFEMAGLSSLRRGLLHLHFRTRQQGTRH